MIFSWIASHWYWFVGAAFIALCVLQPVLVWRLKWQVALAAVGLLAIMQWMAADELRGRLASVKDAASALARAAEADARAAERKRVEDMAALEAALTQENNDALLARDHVIADLRAGHLRLRERFTCPRQPAKTGTATVRGDDSAQGGLRVDDAEFLVRESERADEVARQLTACQAVIRSDRALQK